MFRILLSAIPSVVKPVRRVSFTEKVFWTGVVLVIYLVMSEIPLYGLKVRPTDPLYYLRVIFASSVGTLMELGIGPIVTAGILLQLLVGVGLIKLDLSKPEDRSLFTSANKFLAVVMTFIHAVAFTFRFRLPFQTTTIIIIQLMVAGTILILMDELLQKGWGLGSGISLFIVAGTVKVIWWDLFSPAGPVADGKYHGVVLAYFQGLLQGEGPLSVFFRGWGLPSVFSLLLTIITFAFFIYIENVNVNIPLVHSRFRGIKAGFPIKLLYVSVIPAIFASILIGNAIMLSQVLWSRFPDNQLVGLLGTFNETNQQPTGGLAYYLVPPGAQAIDLGRLGVYSLIFMVLCVVFSILWVQLSGMDSQSVARNLLRAGVRIPGYRHAERSIRMLLDRYIPTVTIVSGIIIGAIVPLTDALYVFGGGIGVLLTVDILYSYYQLLVRERLEEVYPSLASLLRR